MAIRGVKVDHATMNLTQMIICLISVVKKIITKIGKTKISTPLEVIAPDVQNTVWNHLAAVVLSMHFCITLLPF